MITQLSLGNKTYPTNLVQAPLAGFSYAAFRYVTSKYGQVAFTCTEMISCNALQQLRKSGKLNSYKYLVKDPEEGPVCFQLLGKDPAAVAEATKIVTAYGADLVDLNCGCSVKKVRSKGEGSALLRDPRKIYQLIVAMKENTHLPISIKIRVDGKSRDKNNAEIARAVRDGGANFLVVHGRTANEKYNKPCHYEDIQFFVEELKIPVIGNGDVACIESLKKMFATGCAGAMIGRAGVGQPWLTKKLAAAATGQEFVAPCPTEIGAIFLEQVERLIQLIASERFAVIHARKLAHAYARGLPKHADFCRAVNMCDNLNDLTKICQDFFVT